MSGLERASPFAPEYATRVLADVPMARHTSWHVGGPADFFFDPRDAGDLAAFVRQLPAEIALLWIGLGSNLQRHLTHEGREVAGIARSEKEIRRSAQVPGGVARHGDIHQNAAGVLGSKG